MAHVHANRGAEDQKDVWVSRRRWNLEETKSISGHWDGSAKTKRQPLWGEVLCNRKRGVFTVCEIAPPLGKCSVMQSEVNGCELLVKVEDVPIVAMQRFKAVFAL